MPPKTANFEIQTSKINETGRTTPPYIGRFQLLWPRAGVKQVENVVPFPSELGDIENKADWTTLDSLQQRWIFKQPIDGRFIVEVTVLPLVKEDGSSDGPPDSFVNIVKTTMGSQLPVSWSTLQTAVDLGGEALDYIRNGPKHAIAHGQAVVTAVEDQTIEICLRSPNKLGRTIKRPGEAKDVRTIVGGENHGKELEPEEEETFDLDAGEENGYIHLVMNT